MPGLARPTACLSITDRTAAERLGTLVLAGVNAPRDSGRPLRVQTVHDRERDRMKIVILGGAADTAAVLRLLDAVIEDGTAPEAGDD